MQEPSRQIDPGVIPELGDGLCTGLNGSTRKIYPHPNPQRLCATLFGKEAFADAIKLEVWR